MEMLPPVGTFKPDEVLAINLSAEDLAKARASDYQVSGSTDLPEFGVTITHLTPPAAMNAVAAREKLFELLPEAGFVLNRVYSAYRLGSGRQDTATSMPAQIGRGCSAERCFGSSLINWRARLAACGRDVTVGIVDTGFDKSHPALATVRYDYAEFRPDHTARTSMQHGTGVLALLAGESDSGTPGLIPDASFVFANAFFDDAEGEPISDTAQLVKALHWLKRRGVAVVNLSFAGPEDALVHLAVQELTRSGAVVVAAAGNEGPSAPPSYPAAYPEVIAVTAVDRNLAAYRYANRGAHIDIAAPGVEVWTALPGRREGPQTGTSFAVPYVTAVVAVTLSQGGLQANDDALASKRRALERLHGNTRSLSGQRRDPIFGEGLVQAPPSCEPPPLAVAVSDADDSDNGLGSDSAGDAGSQAWAGTVLPAAGTDAPRGATQPLVAGSWISTVRASTSSGLSP